MIYSRWRAPRRLKLKGNPVISWDAPTGDDLHRYMYVHFARMLIKWKGS